MTRGFFELMGAAPRLGRLFRAEEGQRRSGVAILAHGLWQRRFGGDPAVLGRRVILDGDPHLVVGVMPEDFPPPFLDAEVFTPFGITDALWRIRRTTCQRTSSRPASTATRPPFGRRATKSSQ